MRFIQIQNGTEKNKLKGLIRYQAIREKNILALVTQVKNDTYGQRTLHQLRLELKKLKALLELITACSKLFNRQKWSKPFNLIFKKAGKVRDLQVGEALIVPFFKTIRHKAYKNQLQLDQIEAKQEFFKCIHKIENKNLKRILNKIKITLKNIDRRLVNTYMQKIEKRIKYILVQQHLNTANIHDLRKRLKKYYYTKISLDYKKPILPFHDVEVLQELIGKWQDCFILTEHLNKAMNYGNISQGEIHYLKEVRKKITARKATLFKKIKIAISRLHLLKKSSIAMA